MAASNRTYGVVGLLVLVLLAAAAVAVGIVRSEDSGGVPFTADQVSTDLRRATTDLIGYPPDGPPSLEDALAVAGESARDMSSLDPTEFLATWERTPVAQAALVGRWLGLASRELGGADRDRVEEVTPQVTADTPDTDGLREALQAAYADAAN